MDFVVALSKNLLVSELAGRPAGTMPAELVGVAEFTVDLVAELAADRAVELVTGLPVTVLVVNLGLRGR